MKNALFMICPLRRCRKESARSSATSKTRSSRPSTSRLWTERSGPKNLVVFSTSLSKAYNVWENVKIFVAKSIAMAEQRGLEHITIALNAKDAVPFIGKAVEGAILGGYTFDKYRKEKTDRSKLRVHLAAMREADITNKRYLESVHHRLRSRQRSPRSHQ